ncbi:hypothetical protein E4U54_000925, partial [Claviceps lovelessii]
MEFDENHTGPPWYLSCPQCFHSFIDLTSGPRHVPATKNSVPSRPDVAGSAKHDQGMMMKRIRLARDMNTEEEMRWIRMRMRAEL